MIRPGQIYAAVHPLDLDVHGNPRRVRVLAYMPRMSTALVETVHADGSASRRRHLLVAALHENATTRHGKPRRTGYVLTGDGAR